MAGRPKVNRGNHSIKITKSLYDWCAKNKEPVPTIISKNAMYYWVDISDNKIMDELLLWADYWKQRGNVARSLCMSSGSLIKSYNTYPFDKDISV